MNFLFDGFLVYCDKQNKAKYKNSVIYKKNFYKNITTFIFQTFQ